MLLSSSLLLSALLALQGAPDTIPLFASDEPVEVTLEADFAAIRRDHSDEPEERPARVLLPAGTPWRRSSGRGVTSGSDPAYCSFPPLRLNLKKEGTGGTVFAGQDKLKVVVPCHPERDSYEEYVLREYLLYRVYALVTDAAFRVRLARVTFSDASGHDDAFTRWAFLIESDEALAARVGGQPLDIPEGKLRARGPPPPPGSTRVAVFQYMIGNTDWADARVHNVAILAVAGRIVPVPYDFDFAGAVEPPYAVPAPDTPITSVRAALLPGVVLAGPRHRGRPATLPRAPGRRSRSSCAASTCLSGPHARRDRWTTSRSFFDNIATADQAQRRLFRDCRKVRLRARWAGWRARARPLRSRAVSPIDLPRTDGMSRRMAALVPDVHVSDASRGSRPGPPPPDKTGPHRHWLGAPTAGPPISSTTSPPGSVRFTWDLRNGSPLTPEIPIGRRSAALAPAAAFTSLAAVARRRSALPLPPSQVDRPADATLARPRRRAARPDRGPRRRHRQPAPGRNDRDLHGPARLGRPGDGDDGRGRRGEHPLDARHRGRTEYPDRRGGSGVSTTFTATVTAASPAYGERGGRDRPDRPGGRRRADRAPRPGRRRLRQPGEGVAVTFSVLTGEAAYGRRAAPPTRRASRRSAAGSSGPAAGEQTLAARVEAGGVTNNPIVFTATATTPVGSQMVATAGNGQQAPVGQLVPVAPTVACATTPATACRRGGHLRGGHWRRQRRRIPPGHRRRRAWPRSAGGSWARSPARTR